MANDLLYKASPHLGASPQNKRSSLLYKIQTVGNRHQTAKGRGKAWLPVENVRVVLAVCNLPDASIDGANMRTATYEQKVYDQFVQHAPSLDELPDQQKVWRGRSPVDSFLAMQSGSDSKQ
jgi:hypothetical protein